MPTLPARAYRHVIVCGGREYRNAERVAEVLGEHVIPLHPRVIVHHGDARGADRLADLFCMSARIRCRAHPANWAQHGRSAGPIRNIEMLAEVIREAGGHEHVTVIAFPGGRGTAHMVAIAKDEGCEVIEVAS